MRAIVLCALVMSVALAASADGRFMLVRDGKAASFIVIAEKASENAVFAAKELQQYVEKITGAKLPIYTDAQKHMIDGGEILVGRSELTDRLGKPAIPTGVTANLREEGYVVYADIETMVLAGNDTYPYYGTRYAVDDLLGRLGVRWFLPGDYGEVVPKAATLSVPVMSVTEHPDFPVRSFWTHSEGNMAAERELWMIRNRMNPRSPDWFGVPSDGSLVGYLPKDQVKTHPEWFALQPDGTRNANMPCMSDEMRRVDPKFAGQPRIQDEILKKVGEDVKLGLRRSPMAPDDGMPTCDCDLCRANSIRYIDGYCADRAGSGPAPEYLTGQEWFFFVNSLLEKTHAQFPGHLIATNGYANRVVPPEAPAGFNRHHNLTVMFADILGCTIHRYDDPNCWQVRQQYDYIKQWCKLCDKVWIYNYNYTMLVTKHTMTPMTRRVRRNIPLLKDAGVIGFLDQEEADMSMLGIPTYVARLPLEWNVRTDVDAVLNDYYAKWFGPAASPMRHYYEMLEAAFDAAPYHGHEDVILPMIYSPQVMARLAQDIAAAEQAAQTEAEKLHVRAERLIFEDIQCYVAEQQAKQELRFADAAKLMQRMREIKKALHDITPYFAYTPYPVYDEQWEVERMQSLAKLTDGTTGTLFARLPDDARFRTDKHDMGRSERWMEPGYLDGGWQLCRSIGWQNQGLKDEDGLSMMSKDGHNYAGLAWYRYTVNLPAAEGRKIHLRCPSVVNQAWVWVNDQYAGRSSYNQAWFRPPEYDVDVTPFLKAGQNVLTFRVLCTETYFGANGLYEQPFLYAVK